MKKIFIWVLLALTICLTALISLPSKTTEHKYSIYELTSYIRKKLSTPENRSLIGARFKVKIDAKNLKEIKQYQKLQKIIAKKIPHEFDRPSIELFIHWGDNLNSSPDNTIGVLGGMGPLSDASLIEKVIEESSLQKKENLLSIHLFSVPPPRKKIEILQGGIQYGYKLFDFFRKKYSSYFLFSNSAHINYDLIKKLSLEANIIHLPKMLTATIKTKKKHKISILILQTTKAWNSNLYENLLKSANILSTSPNKEEQIEVQRWINKIKRGEIGPNTPEHLKEFIINLAKKHKTNTILFGCTEIPFGLGSILTTFKKQNITIYNSEKIFSHIVARHLTTQSEPPPPRQQPQQDEL